MTTVLHDPVADRALAERGCAVVRLLPTPVAVELDAAWRASGRVEGDGAFRLHHLTDEGSGSDLDAQVGRALARGVAAAFVDHRVFMASVLEKHPGPAPALDHPQAPHRDWMYVDEAAGRRSAMIWLALAPIGPHEGGFRAVPGSHRVDLRPRGSDLDPPWLGDGAAWAPRLVDLRLEAGEAVVFHPGLVHATHANRSAATRVALAAGVRRPEDRLVHFQQVGPRLGVHHLERFDLPAIAARCAAADADEWRPGAEPPADVAELLARLDALDVPPGPGEPAGAMVGSVDDRRGGERA